MEKITDQEIYASIKSGFESFIFLARQNIAKRWAKMSRGDRYAAARALVYMRGVAQEPRKYFARDVTNDQWIWRANQWVQEHNIAPENTACAYYIIQSPTDIVANKSIEALNGSTGLWREYYNFCQNIQNWEYDRTSSGEVFRNNAYKFANKIVCDAANLQKIVQVKKSNAFVRPFKQLAYSFQR